VGAGHSAQVSSLQGVGTAKYVTTDLVLAPPLTVPGI
jgi:hypothetical protein